MSGTTNRSRQSGRSSGVRGPRRAVAPRVAAPVDPATDDFAQAFNQLCHMVALSAAGKTRLVVAGLIEAVLVLSNGGLPDVAAIRATIKRRVAIDIPESDVEDALSSLLMYGRVVREGKSLRLSQATHADVSARIANGRGLEATVRRQWLALARGVPAFAGCSDEALWSALHGYLCRLFQRHGALAIQMIDAGADGGELDEAAVTALLNEAAAAAGLPNAAPLRAAATAFCTDQTDELRAYLSHLLDATFSFYVLRVPGAASRYLRDKLNSLALFLDTNVLYDLLGLHDDDIGGGAAVQVVNFIRQNGLPYALRVHERTIREYLASLHAFEDRMAGKRYSPAVSAAALGEDLGAFDRCYHRLNATEGPVDVAAFVARYENPKLLLRQWGVDVYRADGDTEVKGALTAEYEAFLKEHRPDRPKRYNAIDHDMSVWLAMQELRVADADTALDSGTLLLTNDTSLHKFDWRVLRNGGAGSVVLPAQLMQVLRPFGRADADLDSAFLASLAVPEFRSAHSEYRDTRRAVMSFFATFGDVPTETAAAVLRDKYVLARAQDVSEDSDEFREIIESAVLQENKRLVEEREAREAHNTDLRERLEATEAAARDTQAEHARVLEEMRSELESARAETKHVRGDSLEQVRAAQAETGATRDRLDAQQETLDRLTQESNRRHERAAAARRVLPAALLAAGLVLVIALVPDLARWHAVQHADHRRRLQALLCMLVATSCYLWRGPRRNRREVFFGGFVAVGILVISLLGP